MVQPPRRRRRVATCARARAGQRLRTVPRARRRQLALRAPGRSGVTPCAVPRRLPGVGCGIRLAGVQVTPRVRRGRRLAVATGVIGASVVAVAPSASADTTQPCPFDPSVTCHLLDVDGSGPVMQYDSATSVITVTRDGTAGAPLVSLGPSSWYSFDMVPWDSAYGAGQVQTLQAGLYLLQNDKLTDISALNTQRLQAQRAEYAKRFSPEARAERPNVLTDVFPLSGEIKGWRPP